MHTLLFYTRYHCVPSKGGTEHTTITIAKELLKRYNIHSVSTYTNIFDGESECFDAEYKLPKNKKKATLHIEQIIEKHNVNFIIIQGYFHEIDMFKNAIKNRSNCYLIFAHHFNPGWEILKHGEVVERINRTKGLKHLKYKFKLSIFPVFLKLSNYNLSKRYRHAYEEADKIVLLSSGYIDKFAKFGHFKDHSKFCVIPNALTFAETFNMESYDEKEKIVLIVSRLDERQKRIHLALNIWKQVKNNPNLANWKLQIVGDGERPCVKEYISWTANKGIYDVTFFGRRDPEFFYKKASAFMMTSACEGLPLTIIEAQQQAVVPIVFDTFSSIHDILSNSVNGCIIEEGDLEKYANVLEHLLLDDQSRRLMAENSLESQQKFTKEVVMKKWVELFNDIL